jgi:hypothetical protein
MTTKITTIDRANHALLTKAIDTALAAVGAEFGVQLKTTNGKYSNGGHGHVTVEMGVISADGNAETKEASDFRSMAQYYDMEPSDLGMEFTSNGVAYRLSGIAPRSRKYPFLAERVRDGAVFKFTRNVIQAAKAAKTAKAGAQ